MFRPALAVALLLFVALVPATDAAELKIKISAKDGHPWDAKVAVRTVGENRRLLVPFTVTAEAKEFVCATQTKFVVDMAAGFSFSDQWAGASINPDSATITIPQGEPAAGPKTYASPDEPTLDIDWGDDRPATNAKATYTSTPTVNADGDSCLPPPDVIVEPSPIRITIYGIDLDTNSTRPPTCKEAPELPECQTTTGDDDGGAKSPGFDLAIVLAAAVGLVVAVRRRR